jgi:K+-transporting ATPase ATPase C chain
MKSLRLILVLGLSTILLFGIIYPLTMVGVGSIFHHQSQGLPLYQGDQLVGFENIGQPFSGPNYFWSRPSAVDYNAAATGGSNLGPTNPDLLALVQSRIDTLLKYHPEISPEDIPVEMVTASGSGLDPHISKAAALLQVERVARNRNLNSSELRELIESHTREAWLGLFGPGDRVNVLKLNLALDQLSQS